MEDVHLDIKKIAGVKTPVLHGVDFAVQPFSVFNAPKWYLGGVAILKQLVHISIQREVFTMKMELLDYARNVITSYSIHYTKLYESGRW